MSFPKKHSHTIPPIPSEGITQETLNAAAKAIDEHNQALYDTFAGFTADQIQRMTAEEYTWRRRALEQQYGYHQENHYPGALGRMMARDDPPKPTLDPDLQKRMEEWTRTDPRVEQFWRIMTGRIQRHSDPLNYMLDSAMSALSQLLAEWDQERETLNKRNLDNIRALGEAANEVVTGFDDAKARGDLGYMEAVIEELDSALHDVKYGSE